MTLAEIIRAQIATGRPLRVTRALLEALDASETDAAVMASLRVTAREHAARLPDDLLYGTRTALCEALALPTSTPGPAIIAAVVAIRETAKHDREERDEARRELSHRPTMIAHTAACRERDEARATMLAMRKQRDDYADRLDAAQSRADERDVMRRERDEARAEVERLRAERDEASESLAREQRRLSDRLDVDVLVGGASMHGADDALWRPGETRAECWARHIREAEERGARWALATFFGPESSALVDRSREAARICEAARKAGEHG